MSYPGWFNPEYERYRCLPCRAGVYVFEAGDAVKVGRSQCLYVRLKELHRIFLLAGRQPGRFHCEGVPCDSYSDLFDAERECLRAMRRVATGLTRKSEYFTGITFERAVDVVRLVLMHPTPSTP